MAKMHHPDASASCSVAGVQYEPGEDGCVDVPDEAVGALLAHGFVPGTVPEPAEEPEPPPARRRAR